MRRAPTLDGAAPALGEFLRLVGAWEIATRLGLSRQRIQQLSDRDDFPAPFGELKMGRVWWEHEVEEWIHEWRTGEMPRPSTVHECDRDAIRSLAERIADYFAERGYAFVEDDQIDVLTDFLQLFLTAIGTPVRHPG